MLLFTFSQPSAISSLLGTARPSPLSLRRKCSNQLLSAVYSLMCLQPSTSVPEMRKVSRGLLLCRVRVASPLPASSGANAQLGAGQQWLLFSLSVMRPSAAVRSRGLEENDSCFCSLEHESGCHQIFRHPGLPAMALSFMLAL